MRQPQSFLVINPFGIGDVLFSTALLRTLKEAFPSARIYYLCNRKTEPVLKAHPLVYKVFVYERDEFVAAGKRSWLEWGRMFCSFIGDIRGERIDAALDLSLNTQYGFFAWLAGVPQRLGLDYRRRCWFLTRRIPIAGYTEKPVAEYYLDLLSLLNVAQRVRRLEVVPDLKSRSWAASVLQNLSVAPADLVIGIAPCGGDAFGRDAGIKRWPAEHFSELINRLTAQMHAKILIFAGPKEKKDVGVILQKVASPERVFEFTDATLAQTVALVDRCALFIGNDTGPLRFADGLHKRIVALFGPVDDRVYGPYPPEVNRTAVLSGNPPCRPCYRNFRLAACQRNKQCLTDVPVDAVFAAAQRLLKG